MQCDHDAAALSPVLFRALKTIPGCVSQLRLPDDERKDQTPNMKLAARMRKTGPIICLVAVEHRRSVVQTRTLKHQCFQRSAYQSREKVVQSVVGSIHGSIQCHYYVLKQRSFIVVKALFTRRVQI